MPVTSDGSTFVSHSNDGDGDCAGNIKKIPAKDWSNDSQRSVSNGQIPQVPHTHAYYTEGYAIMNEYQVALGESTCTAIFRGTGNQRLDIVDLGQLGLERARSALEAVSIMGNLSYEYGYRDAGESLIVTDPKEAYIFHVLPDDTGYHSIWVAMRVPDGHVTAVMNAFVIRKISLSDSNNFLYSANLPKVAESLGWDPRSGNKIDFTAVFSGVNEGSCKYSSGRRMWAVYNALAPSAGLSPYYSDYTTASPYPATIRPDQKGNCAYPFLLLRCCCCYLKSMRPSL